MPAFVVASPIPRSFLGGGRAKELNKEFPPPPESRCLRCPDYGPDSASKKPALRVYGLVTSIPYQRARHCVEKLSESFGDRMERPIIEGMLDFEWEEYLIDEQRMHGGWLWAMKTGVVVWDANYMVGSDKDLEHYIASDILYTLPVNSMSYFLRMVDDYHEILRKSKTVFVVMEFQAGECPIGSMMFELFTQTVPATCRNFINLCKGEGQPNDKGKTFCYKGSRVHRIVADGWIQCGDVTKIIGGGGHSSLGSKLFPDEARAINHNKRGVLSMCNRGPNTNQSQFFITLNPGPWMNPRYVAFGQAVEGANVLRLLESMRTLYGVPVVPVVITDCSVLEEGARLWPSPPGTPTAWRPLQPVPPPPVPSEDALKAPAMPPAPPAIAKVIAKEGKTLWDALNARDVPGLLKAKRREEPLRTPL